MRYLFFILILIVSQNAFTQATLRVNIKDCRDKGAYAYLSEIMLYKNNALVKTIDTKHSRNHVLKDLSSGKYKIEYTSIFGKTESASIDIGDKKNYSLDLCVDYIDHAADPHSAMIDLLKDGESYTIRNTSTGCFHHTVFELKIIRKLDDYFVIHDGVGVQLAKSQVEIIRNFEIELNYAEDWGCTTTDVYTIEYKGKKKTFEDGSCRWDGDYYLKRGLGIKD